MFEGAGVSAVRLNEIVAFTPTAVTLQAVASRLETPNGDWARLSISERLYFDGGRWEQQAALPSRARSTAYQVLARTKDDLALRLLKDGTATVMRSRGAQPAELIADCDECIAGTAVFVTSSLAQLVGKGDGEIQLNDLVMDERSGIALPLDCQPPYPVCEIELASADRLEHLVRDDVDDVQRQLDKLLLYLVARNYRLPGMDNVSLENLCDEVLPDILDDGFLLHSVGGRRSLRNLSQGCRAFIAFGRRGTIVVHTPSVPSLPIRCSVLSMVETLRSRFQNLLVATALMDTLLLRLAQLMDTSREGPVTLAETETVKIVLRELATATYIYGLAVTDPGVQLLDGSVISIIADHAEEYFEIQSLRHACQRKMEAIRTIWASYQDRRRQTLLRALRVMEPTNEGRGER